ncbi:cation/H(+) antiporter 18 [Cannabis sativa]|uniref:cation/H(+) antiporter 18 n=1 Tax=Cannabis sativa TaxID=3483 RepID=UPI0029CA37F1|nr:cation/H(+) antiporter 18 [Cannabis sativa]
MSGIIINNNSTISSSSSSSSNSSSVHAMKATSNGVFQGDNPLEYALPLAIVQIVLVLILTRFLAFLFKPLRQPRVIAEIVGGIILGPSLIGRNTKFLNTIFPAKSLTVLDTLANLGLLFFLFLVGLELDLKAIKKTGKKALCIAAAGISLPFVLGIGTSFALRATISKGVEKLPFIVFMGVALSITAFPVLARILAELKLLTTDVGRMAMSAAAVNDVAAWILLALAIALSGDSSSPMVSLWVLLCGTGFVVFCYFVIPPIFRWMAKRCPEGEPIKELYVCVTFALVLVAGLATDAVGIHALFGAFVVGILVPKEGPFAVDMVEKVEDLVSSLLLPLYFVSSGLKTNVATISGAQSWGLLVLVILTACSGKILGTLGVSLLCKIPFQDSLALGIIMNTKGLVEIIVLNIGKDRKVLNDQTFAIMVLMAIFTTFITTPIVIAVYKPIRKTSKSISKDRSIEKKKDTKTELRIMACFHNIRNVPSMINLIEASRGTEKKEKLCVYALHLMELSERTSAILMVHRARKNGLPFWNNNNNKNNDCDKIIVAFEAFQQLSQVSIRPMTAISTFTTMHEDIIKSADRKNTAMIILPFHKHQKWDGTFETTRAEFRVVNKRVLEQAPCSVGIFVDRGLGGTTHIAASNVCSELTVVFFGGSDDCEALAFGLRMAEHPGNSLKVVHFLPSSKLLNDDGKDNVRVDVVSSENENNKAIFEVKEKSSKDDSIEYVERFVDSFRDVVEGVRDFNRCNLFLVGRTAQGVIGECLSNSNVSVKSECPELGALGNLLVSSEFSTTASVLIVQQHQNHQMFSTPTTSNPTNDHKVEVVSE